MPPPRASPTGPLPRWFPSTFPFTSFFSFPFFSLPSFLFLPTALLFLSLPFLPLSPLPLHPTAVLLLAGPIPSPPFPLISFSLSLDQLKFTHSNTSAVLVFVFVFLLPCLFFLVFLSNLVRTSFCTLIAMTVARRLILGFWVWFFFLSSGTSDPTWI